MSDEPARATAAAATDAPPDENRHQHLDPRHVDHGRLVGAVMTAIVAFTLSVVLVIVLLAADSLSTSGRLLCVAVAVTVTAAIAAFAWRWPVLAHAHTSYRCGADGLEVRRGVWWRREIHVPRSRIQHTDVSQGPLERRFGLATVHVFTAGTDNAEVALAGLAHEIAKAIRDQLLAGVDDDVV